MRYQPGTLVIHRATNGADIGLVISVHEQMSASSYGIVYELMILWPSGISQHNCCPAGLFPVLQHPR